MKKVCIWELSKANNNLKFYWIYIGTASLTGVVKNWIGVGKYLNLMANKIDLVLTKQEHKFEMTGNKYL